MAPEVREFDYEIARYERAVEAVGLESPAVYIAVEWDAEVECAIAIIRAFGVTSRFAL